MKPIRAIKNQYQGINAHLHSMWQAEGGWAEFHTAHIIDLTRTLKNKLLPLGYTAGIEDSLQIHRSDPNDRDPKSDVLIYDTDPVRSLLPVHPTVMVAEQIQVLAIPEVLDEFEELSEYRAIPIYVVQHRRKADRPVAWIEILSPSNKLQDFQIYRRKRLDLLKSGIVLIELDYLHDSPPTLQQVANYASWRKKSPRPANARPYRIVVIDPRPDVITGKVYHHQFDVDEPLPTVTIPLHATDRLAFDFDVPYQRTIAETFFAYEYVDYAQHPTNFDHYSPADQQRILNRMIAVMEAVQAGINLENDSFPTQNLPLESAQIKVEKLRTELSTP